MKNRHLKRTHYHPQSHGSAEAEADFAQAGRHDERRASGAQREATTKHADARQRDSERTFAQSYSPKRSPIDDRNLNANATHTPKGDGAEIPTVVTIRQPWYDGIWNAFTSSVMVLVVPLLASLALVLVSPKMTSLDAGPGASVANLSSIKIVQMGDADVARERVDRDAPAMSEMYHEWESEHHVAIVGSQPDVMPILIPLPRKGFEKNFSNLKHAGLGNVWLNLFFPPMSGLAAFDKQLTALAKRCRVPRESIKRWSTLRNPVTGARDGFCRPGGMCVMLSFGPCGESKSPNDRMEAGPFS